MCVQARVCVHVCVCRAPNVKGRWEGLDWNFAGIKLKAASWTDIVKLRLFFKRTNTPAWKINNGKKERKKRKRRSPMAATQGQRDADMVTWFITSSSHLFTFNNLFLVEKENKCWFSQWAANAASFADYIEGFDVLSCHFVGEKKKNSESLLSCNQVNLIIKYFKNPRLVIHWHFWPLRAPRGSVQATAEACGTLLSLWLQLLCSLLSGVMASSVFPSLPRCICSTHTHPPSNYDATVLIIVGRKG